MHLTGHGLLLRPFTVHDVPALLHAADDDEQRRWAALPSTYGGAVLWCATRAGWEGTFAVTDGADLLGYLSLHEPSAEHESIKVGYWTAAAARGHGVATRAMAVARAHVFDTLGLHRLELWHAVENVGSCRVATKAGLAHEGTHREAYRYPDGQLHDEHSHAALASDPRGL